MDDGVVVCMNTLKVKACGKIDQEPFQETGK